MLKDNNVFCNLHCSLLMTPLYWLFALQAFGDSICHCLQKYCLNYSTAILYLDSLKLREDFGSFVKVTVARVIWHGKSGLGLNWQDLGNRANITTRGSGHWWVVVRNTVTSSLVTQLLSLSYIISSRRVFFPVVFLSCLHINFALSLLGFALSCTQGILFVSWLFVQNKISTVSLYT